MKPTIGRIVIYHDNIMCCDFPAIIVKVRTETQVDLQVFGNTPESFRYTVPKGDNLGMWNWPPEFKSPEIKLPITPISMPEENPEH